jgi:choline dehydrogenase
VVDGARQSTAGAYLRPALHRPNLTVTSGAFVLRLLVKGGRCHGVEYLLDGVCRRAHAGGEVVLAAGAIGSPQLLLRSGIGPADQLREVGVEASVDLPGVGANLHDHPLTGLVYTASRPTRSRTYAGKPVALLRTRCGVIEPDIQLAFLDLPALPPRGSAGRDGYTIMVSLMTPASRGSLRLASADPTVPPLVDQGFLTDERDVDWMVTGLRLAREVAAVPALRDWRGEEVTPGQRDDAGLRDYLRGSVGSYSHPVGTCRMGGDERAVVDPRLRVRGVEGLRVVDASVMPSIVSADPNATVLAIAERAAAWLREG